MKNVNLFSRLRPLMVKLLQKTHLNKLAHKIYYSYVHGFKPAIPTTLHRNSASERGLRGPGFLALIRLPGYRMLKVLMKPSTMNSTKDSTSARRTESSKISIQVAM
jgi:hypothetical protein